MLEEADIQPAAFDRELARACEAAGAIDTPEGPAWLHVAGHYQNGRSAIVAVLRNGETWGKLTVAVDADDLGERELAIKTWAENGPDNDDWAKRAAERMGLEHVRTVRDSVPWGWLEIPIYRLPGDETAPHPGHA